MFRKSTRTSQFVYAAQVPHFAREPKSLGQQGEQLHFQLTVSKIHNMCNVADWQYGGQFSGPGSGCNFSCSILLANLHLIEEMKGDIPRHLKLQMDNCAKDNKNSTVLGFCGLLVAEGVVETAEVSTDRSNIPLIDTSTHPCRIGSFPCNFGVDRPVDY